MTPFVTIALVLGGAFGLSLYFALAGKFLRDGSESALPLQASTGLFGGLILIGYCLFLEGEVRLPFGEAWLFWSLALLSHLLSQLALFQALKRIDVAVVSSFSALTPAFASGAGWLMLGEVPDVVSAAGIALITLGILGMNRKDLLRASAAGGGSSRAGLACALFSSFLPALGQGAGKRAILDIGAPSYQCSVLFSGGVVLLLLLLRRKRPDSIPVTGKTAAAAMAFAVLFACSSLALSEALTVTDVAQVSGMARMSIVFQVFLAYLLAGQRNDLFSRAIWSAWIFAGVLLLAAGTAGEPRAGGKWSETTLRAFQASTGAGVYYVRYNSQTLNAALVHALIAKRPAVIVHPDSPFLTPERIERFRKAAPLVQWLELNDINAVTPEDVARLTAMLPALERELFIPEITLANFYDRESSGLPELLQLMARVHIYEEGMYTYATLADRLAADQGKSESSFKSLFAAPGYAFYVSRPDLLPVLPAISIREFDQEKLWRRLSKSERESILAFFEFDPGVWRRKIRGSARPSLLLLGAKATSQKDKTSLMAWVTSVHKELGGKYKLFFKGHPGDTILADFITESYPGKIEVIDSRMPFEMLEATGVTFEQYAVAGLSSTLLHIPPGRLAHCFEYRPFEKHAPLAEKLVGSKVVR